MAGFCVSGVGLYAHHSFAGTYLDEAKPVTIEGTIKTFLLRNPHSFVQVEAPDDKGVMQRWSVEWGAAGQLAQQGVGSGALKPGDHVMVTGSPSRDPADHRLRMKSIDRPSDGWKWPANGQSGTFN